MSYMIESHAANAFPGNEDWSEEYVTNDSAANRFSTENEAEAAIAELRTNGGEWNHDNYRVVEIED